jgi:hypothetical protein
MRNDAWVFPEKPALNSTCHANRRFIAALRLANSA